MPPHPFETLNWLDIMTEHTSNANSKHDCFLGSTKALTRFKAETCQKYLANPLISIIKISIHITHLWFCLSSGRVRTLNKQTRHPPEDDSSFTDSNGDLRSRSLWGPSRDPSRGSDLTVLF